jgi:hypothetical protein
MNTTPPPPPDELTPGTHLTPDDGACLMVWVSVLVGEPWSDAPATTHPLLAHLGRLVNDATTPASRGRLLPLAPRLAHLTSHHPATHARLAELVTRYALEVSPRLRLAWMHAAAARQVVLATRSAPRSRVGRELARLRLLAYRRGPAHRAVEVAVGVLRCTARGNDHLLDVLERGVRLMEADTFDVPEISQGRWRR